MISYDVTDKRILDGHISAFCKIIRKLHRICLHTFILSRFTMGVFLLLLSHILVT